VHSHLSKTNEDKVSQITYIMIIIHTEFDKKYDLGKHHVLSDGCL